jgi:hypothetical protein
MPQAYLGANPGTTIEDALEPELLDDASVSADVTVTWVAVNFPATVVVVTTLGTIAAGVTNFEIEVEGADDTSATNLVSYGRFAPIDGSDDDETRVLTVDVFKPYMGVTIDYEGTGAVEDVKIVVRPKDWQQGNTRTA